MLFRSGVGAAMVLCVTGTLLFAAQRRTQPQPRGPGRAGGSSPVPRPRRARTWAAVPGLVTLVPVYWFLGAMFATIDLSTVGFAAEHGHLPLAGLVLGAYALGSAIGGLWYGTRHWRTPLERRFAITLACTVAGVATFWLQPGLMSLVAVIIVAGMSISPTLIAGYGLIERQAPPERRTEGMTWLSSATDSSEKAVCRRPVPASSTLHRARTIDPTDGMVAPARAPGTTTAASGAPISASVMKTTVAAPNTATCGRSTRRWPNRSMSLAICGAPSA